MGCLGPSQSTKVLSGCQSRSWGPSRGAWVCFGVPGSPLGCQNQFRGAWVCLGVRGSVWEYQHPSWGARAHFGVVGSVLECQGLFWGARTPFGTPEPILGCPCPSGGPLWGPLVSGCCCTPKPLGALRCSPTLQRQGRGAAARFGGPGPPSWFGGVGVVPRGVGAGGGRDLGTQGTAGAWSRFGGLKAVLEGPLRVEGKGGPPKIGAGSGLCPPLIMNPPGPGQGGRGGLRADLGVPPRPGELGVSTGSGRCGFWGVAPGSFRGQGVTPGARN